MLIALRPPRDEDHVYEPHVAIDPADPLRAAVVAMHPVEGWRVGRRILCWRTEDGGLTWTAGPIPQPRFDGEGAADPLIVYGAKGSLIAAAMAIPSETVELQRRWSYTRSNAGQRLRDIAEAQARGEFRADQFIYVARSDDNGTTWSSSGIPGSEGGDKPALAVDRNTASPYCGRIYVAWTEYRRGTYVAFARSVDGGHTAEPAVRIAPADGVPQVQLAVGPDGTVHALWRVFVAPDLVKGGVQDVQAGMRIYYARSVDGGDNFNDPLIVATHGGSDRTGIPSLATSPTGALLAVWSEAEAPAPSSSVQARHSLRWIHSRDGVNWTAPALMARLGPHETQGLPAAASTEGAWYVLSYDATLTQTAVRIYRADHDKIRFRPVATLATRDFGSNEIWLWGNYALRWVDDIAIVGDYAGLAAGRSVVAAAVVLPMTHDWRSRRTAYVAILNEDDLLE